MNIVSVHFLRFTVTRNEYPGIFWDILFHPSEAPPVFRANEDNDPNDNLPHIPMVEPETQGNTENRHLIQADQILVTMYGHRINRDMCLAVGNLLKFALPFVRNYSRFRNAVRQTRPNDEDIFDDTGMLPSNIRNQLLRTLMWNLQQLINDEQMLTVTREIIEWRTSNGEDFAPRTFDLHEANCTFSIIEPEHSSLEQFIPGSCMHL